VGGDTLTSAPVTVYHLPAPVSGTTVADFDSGDVATWLAGGATLSFVGGTEAVQLTNGVLSVGPDTNEASIERLYEGLLGRSAEPAGLTFYDAQIASGTSLATVATEILSSPEYLADHGVQTDQELVATLYQGLLGRPAAADPNSSFWVTQLEQGATPGDVTAAIASSPEAKTYLATDTAQIFVANPAGTLATELYQTGLDRTVDLPSLANFQASYAVLTPLQLAAQIVASSEFIADHAGQSNAAFVASLYEDGLGRAPDPSGAAFWTGLLNSGQASQAGVLLGIATSGEANIHLTPNLTT